MAYTSEMELKLKLKDPRAIEIVKNIPVKQRSARAHIN